MSSLVPIVEGNGEVTAVPILLRRMLYEMYGRYDWQVLQLKNTHGAGGLVRQGGIERFLELALLEPDCSGVLVLIDNDAVSHVPTDVELADNCSPLFARYLANRIRPRQPYVPVAIVTARWEYEAWFLASLETLAGKYLPKNVRYENNVENKRGAKEWLSKQIGRRRGYSEMRDQPAMTSAIDLSLVETRSRSFRRLVHAVQQIVEGYERGEKWVTPT